jgi:hypothetical protein
MKYSFIFKEAVDDFELHVFYKVGDPQTRILHNLSIIYKLVNFLGLSFFALIKTLINIIPNTKKKLGMKGYQLK